jgi:ribA/ribD-fused uncharacterized protein
MNLSTQPRRFRGSTDVLSNLWEFPFLYDGECYQSVEQAYQHAKALHHNDVDLAKRIAKTSRSWDCMNLGNQIRCDSVWLNHRRQAVMWKLLVTKFNQSQEYRSALASAEQFVEDTGHSYWGRGWDGCGLNVMGKLHQRLREWKLYGNLF